MTERTARGWFRTSFGYEGPAVLTFSNRDELTGTGRVEVNEDLAATAILRVTQADYRGLEEFSSFGLLFALSNLPPGFRGLDPPAHGCLFRMQLPGGEVRSVSDDLDFQTSFTAEGPCGPELLIRLGRGPFEFTCRDLAPPAYFVVPLVNYVAHWVGYNAALDTHPLRLLRPAPLPEFVVREHPEWVTFEHQRRNGTVEFEFRGGRAFIQPVEDYDERQERLEAGLDRARITALLIGDVADNPITWPALQDWIPAGLASLLSLATGSDVEIPWIEFRAADGALQRRLHFGSLPPVFARRGHIIDERIHRGTGRLLSQALRSPHFGKPHLHVAVGTICGRPDRVLNLDNRLRELIVALEALANGPGVDPAEPNRRELSPPWRRKVDKVFAGTKQALRRVESEAKARIKMLAREAAAKGHSEDQALLGRVAELVRCALSDDRSFGMAVKVMLAVLDLQDARVLNPWFRSHHAWKRDWISVIAKLRALVVHRGSVGVGSKGRSTGEIVEIIRHLEDLLVRAVFRLLNYDGLYQPAVEMWSTDAAVGWVTKDTSPAQLGFKSTTESKQAEA
ncbi:MAG: hypothetical protein LAO05_05965 [Acidobacteriia bacterium]|nr:hypothetical protein [Terriglobia bacterium]